MRMARECAKKIYKVAYEQSIEPHFQCPAVYLRVER